MVNSNINKSIVYSEVETISTDDKEYSANLYEIVIDDNNILIALGQEKHKYISENIVYFPIYLVLHNDTVKQIGIYETNLSKLSSLLDEDGDIDIILFDAPLLFSDYYKYFNQAKDPTIETDNSDPENSIEHTNTTVSTDNDIVTVNGEPEEDDTDTTQLFVVKKELENKQLGIYDEIKHVNIKTIPEQTLENRNKETGTISTDDLWIRQYLSNENFDLIDNEGGGDCLFAVIRDALESVGKMISVRKLRELLSNEVTEEIFFNFKDTYKMLSANIKTVVQEMKDINAENKTLKLKLQKTQDSSEQLKIVNHGKELKNRYAILKNDKILSSQIINEYKFMKTINNLNDFKSIIKTNKFWGETWTLSTLERVLNVKFILLSEEYYNDGDIANVLQCGQLNDTILETKGEFNPDYYIILNYTGTHYKLISYHDRKIFVYKEIPYDIKQLILNKCLEKIAGPYSLIKEFVNEKLKHTIKSDEISENVTTITPANLYDNEIVFRFYAKSSNKPYPGKGIGEQIDNASIAKFKELALIPDWRKKIDHFWITPFEIDGHNWNSVEHYYQGAKFKNSNPKFYYQFSLDSNSTLSKDPNLAYITGSKSGKYKGKQIRPEGIEHDIDFFGKRREIEMEKAIYAKFSQNQDLKNTILNTKNAKLVRFKQGTPPIVCNILMKVREKLSS